MLSSTLKETIYSQSKLGCHSYSYIQYEAHVTKVTPAYSVIVACKSPEISIINFVLDYVYKKSVETCRAHHVTGIAKRHRRNELRNKYPTLSYIPYEVQRGLYAVYTNRMSVALSSSLY